jgi:hypothetical protein
MRLVPAVALAGLLLSASACSDSPEDVRADYCEEVADRQVELTEVMAQEGPDTLLRAVPVLRALAEEAPRDLEDEWDRLLDALDGLDEALDTAGVDATTYDAKRPPAGMTPEQQRAIARAADELATQETVAAWEGVKQHAKDVCKTPLYQ